MIVRRIARKTFRQLSAGDAEPLIQKFSPDAVFCFVGRHALGGELRGPEAIGQWFGRVFRLFPDFRIEPHTIVVNGPPWNTVIGTRFMVSATLPSGQRYANEGMQFLRLRWGHPTEDRLYEDTQALVAALEIIAAHGNQEAEAGPFGPIGAPSCTLG
ncbi:MAG: nuclear transport factor 2 family protein [Actinomycetota bacterium]|nr:nuclear transport factor 2 family protein [Actinomycetota bacterium]